MFHLLSRQRKKGFCEHQFALYEQKVGKLKFRILAALDVLALAVIPATLDLKGNVTDHKNTQCADGPSLQPVAPVQLEVTADKQWSRFQSELPFPG